MNNAPFKVGDRVVVLMSTQYLKKGLVYNVLDCFKFCNCGWAVKVEGKHEYGTRCKNCGHETDEVSAICPAKYFALVQPRHEDAEIDESILEQARELIGISETVAPVHQPVNN